MPVKQSQEYYFPRGDLILKIESTLFRIHRDIISFHSGFFRDMLDTPTSDKKEGTSDEHPLRLPRDLCRTAEAFATLCKFMYPKKLGELPRILIQDFDAWNHVLEATLALQMPEIREHVISRFRHDKTAIASEPVKLLTWATRPEIECDVLKLGCIRAIIYRRLPILPTEAAILGAQTTSQLMHFRERVRTILTTRPKPTTTSGSTIRCASRPNCENGIFQAIINNMIMDWTESSNQSKLDIFQIDNVSACPVCLANKDKLARSLMYPSLDNEIQQCAKAVGLRLYGSYASKLESKPLKFVYLSIIFLLLSLFFALERLYMCQWQTRKC